MKLSEYIKQFPNKVEARQKLAENIGCSEFTVKSWANGARFPNRKWWGKISEATNGHVSVSDIVEQ